MVYVPFARSEADTDFNPDGVAVPSVFLSVFDTSLYCTEARPLLSVPPSPLAGTGSRNVITSGTDVSVYQPLVLGVALAFAVSTGAVLSMFFTVISAVAAFPFVSVTVKVYLPLAVIAILL